MHTVKDQCAFVLANCPDEEAGLFSYLQLYFCLLSGFKPLAFCILVLWASLLFSTIGIAASDFFCVNLSTIATILGMSESMAGVTFLAFGNGSPDVFSTFAAMSTHSGSLAIGELIGAAGFITAVVAGSMALVRPFRVAKKSFVRDLGFFIVATSFSMVFLADGHLHTWECAVMVAFYIFYVVTVVIWHWYLSRTRKRRLRDALARNHFNAISSSELDVDEDADEEIGNTGRGRTISRNSLLEDFTALERDEEFFPNDLDEEADDETRDRWMAEISSNMRVNRPKISNRRSTVNPIRPSLVGALEFRAVLSSLHKARSMKSIPISLRRYSDDPSLALAQQQQRPSTTSDPRPSQLPTNAHEVIANRSFEYSNDSDDQITSTRVRAVSANDAVDVHRISSNAARLSIPQIDYLGPTPPPIANLQNPRAHSSNNTPTIHEPSGLLIPSPVYEIANPYQPPSRSSTFSTDHLAPPQDHRDSFLPAYDYQGKVQNSGTEASGPGIERQPSGLSLPGTAGSSPAVPFPPYRDNPEFVPFTSRPASLRLPPPSVGSDSVFHDHLYDRSSQRPISWWPYKVLPSPEILVSTLFPTLYSWHNKNLWERLLGVIAAPSVFLLAITLPVVESTRGEDVPDSTDYDPSLDIGDENRQAPLIGLTIAPPTSSEVTDDSEHLLHTLDQRELLVQPQGGAPSDEASRVDAHITERGSRSHAARDGMSLERPAHSGPENASHIPLSRRNTDLLAIETSGGLLPSPPKGWNRWLVSTQIFTAPVFVVLITWANIDPTLSARNFLIPCLYTLLGSSLILAVVLLTTSEAKPPRYRYILCFLGFIVSIAWISTIANEVVGVLKAFGVILGISDAILGLTIFAVGNSLGDLVADITVAKLGFPVMALSACFGGPMLNILLGIGLSGLYMTMKHGNGKHDKHSTVSLRYSPYELDVASSLIISGITLLITLVGLLIAVPLNRWQMDKKIGWGLVTLWCCSTVINLTIEIFGWAGTSTS